MIAIRDDPTGLRVDAHGAVRVGQTNMLLDRVVEYYLAGESPADIVDAFPALGLADVYGAIAYYLRHREEVDEYLADGERIAQQWIARIDSDPRHLEFHRRMEQARKGRDAPARI